LPQYDLFPCLQGHMYEPVVGGVFVCGAVKLERLIISVFSFSV